MADLYDVCYQNLCFCMIRNASAREMLLCLRFDPRAAAAAYFAD
jgi:hypothetical protein